MAKSLRAGDTAYASTQYEKAREELVRAAGKGLEYGTPRTIVHYR